MASKTSRTISFRLGGAALQALEHRAQGARASVGEQARVLVVGALEHRAELELADRVSGLEQELGRFRADLARAFQTLLLNLQPDLGQAEVRSVIPDRLRYTPPVRRPQPPGRV